MQTFYSIQLIKSAAYFTRKSVEIDKIIKQEGKFNSTLSSEQHSNVVASIFMSKAYIEATINELLAESQKKNGALKDFNQNKITLIKRLLEDDKKIDKMSTLSKFDIILNCLGHSSFDKGLEIYQEVKLLTQLRNGLTHYNASWFDWGSHRKGSLAIKQDGKFLKELFKKFPHPLNDNLNRHDKWINSSCATWALNTAVTYTDEFFSRIEITPTMEHIREELNL